MTIFILILLPQFVEVPGGHNNCNQQNDLKTCLAECWSALVISACGCRHITHPGKSGGCGSYVAFDVISRHDDVIKWKPFPRYWPFVWGIHRSPVNSPHKDQWRGALMISMICAWINGWVNSRDAGDLRRHRANYDVIIMRQWSLTSMLTSWTICTTPTYSFCTLTYRRFVPI